MAPATQVRCELNVTRQGRNPMSIVVGCKNAALEEERRTLRQRCAEFQTAMRSAESSRCRLSDELGSCRGQLTAVQARLQHVEAAGAAAARRDGELQTVNAALRRDVDHAHQQVPALQRRRPQLSIRAGAILTRGQGATPPPVRGLPPYWPLK